MRRLFILQEEAELKFASLGSGSEGNALVVAGGAVDASSATTVMVDCGFGLKETERRLERLGLAPADLAGIVVTHEHKDHVGGVLKLARRFDIPVWMTYGTWQATGMRESGVRLQFCRDGEPIIIDNLTLRPYTVPHDAREPVQYTISDGAHKLGVLTDAGQATQHLIAALHGCDALILECNHDRQMLADSDYPASLKYRIGGIYGHLANDVTATILDAVDRSRLRTVIGAHLSRQNNTAELARRALTGVVGDAGAIDVRIACQDDGFDWIVLAE